jgi:hypothetical protein
MVQPVKLHDGQQAWLWAFVLLKRMMGRWCEAYLPNEAYRPSHTCSSSGTTQGQTPSLSQLHDVKILRGSSSSPYFHISVHLDPTVYTTAIVKIRDDR